MYGQWTELALLPPHSVPSTLAPVFLLVLSLYTCLPLPTLVSFMAGLLVSGLHLFGLAMSGANDYGSSPSQVNERCRRGEGRGEVRGIKQDPPRRFF